MFCYVAANAESLLPLIEKSGVATRAEVDIDTLADRLTAEASALRAWAYYPELVGAWATVSLSAGNRTRPRTLYTQCTPTCR
jgi:hypothetical protein